MGSLVAALASYLDARARGGTWLLRIEDVDTTRSRPHFETEICQQLERHGLQWDEVPVRQSERGDFYSDALRNLASQGRVYSCGCSRKSLQSRGCRENSEGELIYPGVCRAAANFLDRSSSFNEGRALRFLLPPEATYSFVDLICGEQSGDVQSDAGDFVLKRADGCFTYHLAVVVDDYLQGITRVVRGADILPLTGRHLLLQDALGYPQPEYSHIPLVLGPEGRKLSKSESAAAIAQTPAIENLVCALKHIGLSCKADDFASVADVLKFAVHEFKRSLDF
jgi:glutamyl-Q tRNA(Asp) synthetase